MHASIHSKCLYVLTFSFLLIAAVCSLSPYSFPVIQIGSTLYSLMAIAWAISLDRRILDQKIRIFLIVAALLMALWCLLRAVKNCYLMDAPDKARRVVWYLYYLPLLGIPLFMLFAALNINRSKEASPVIYVLCAVITALFLSLVMTNDNHQVIFTFDSGLENWEHDFGFGMLYYPLLLWVLIELVAMLIILIHQSTTKTMRRHAWVPVVPILISIGYWLIHYFLPMLPPALFEIPELFCFAAAFAAECSLLCGMIPSNTGYETIFRVSTVPMQIENKDGHVVFSSAAASSVNDMDIELDDMQIHTQPIYGGNIIWSDNVAEINQKNRQLAEITDQLSEEMTLLKAENDLKEAKAQYETQNRLYDKISAEMHPKIDEVAELISDETINKNDFRARLAKACFLTAYIKRLSNMMLIADTAPTISTQEFELALSETFSNLRLCGPTCAIFHAPGYDSETMLDSELLLSAYKLIQAILELAFDSMSAVMLNLGTSQGELQIKLSLTSEPINLKNLSHLISFQTMIHQSREDDTNFISINMRKAGGKQ